MVSGFINGLLSIELKVKTLSNSLLGAISNVKCFDEKSFKNIKLFH
ncbi:hypothetical protein F3D3_4549 [Fusibacter sp. 3D3]|nr:hypothetical protein F3D3_4549 [Fusibacter sp. 3D3]